MNRCRILVCGALFVLLTGGTPVQADDAIPSRVGRVAAADGNVAVRPGASAAPANLPGAEWGETGINHPVAAGMAVRTAPESRAVLQIGGETIALSGGTELEVAQLDHRGTRIALRRGRIGVSVTQLDPARSIDIDIPLGGVRLQGPGDYDIMAGGDKLPTRIAAIDGGARFDGKRLAVAVAAGGALLLVGDDPVAALPGGADDHGLAAWWRPGNRDRVASKSLRHVPAAMTGHEALDEHGSWETVEGYGAVWFPDELPDDWAPYRHGHWRWVAPWGWTWIDDLPWGFAPSHYGRWARIDGSDAQPARWGWVPGTGVEHPAYMPAAVAFLGTAGVGLSYPDAFSPAVAWFPLAPGEVYWPAFTDELAAIRHLNAGAVADPAAIGPALKNDPPAAVVTGDYRNRRFASVVPRAVFVGGKPVTKSLIELPPRRLDNAPLLAGSPQIPPSAPRPPVLLSSAASAGRLLPKLAKARETLARILKRRDAKEADVKTGRPSSAAPAAARARATPRQQPRVAKRPPARPRVGGLPKSGAANPRQAAAQRR